MQAPWPLGVGLIVFGLIFMVGNRRVHRATTRDPIGRWAGSRVHGLQADASGRNLHVIAVGTFCAFAGACVVVAALAR